VTVASDSLDALRVDQVGGLVGPSALRAAARRFEAGEIDAAAMRAAEDDAIRTVLRKQEEIGLPILSDGELRRKNFQESFALSVSGYDTGAEAATGTAYRQATINRAPSARAEQDFTAAGPPVFTRRPVVARLALIRNVPLEEYAFASRQTATPVKVAMMSPDRISQRFAWEESRDVYSDMDAFVADVVAIGRAMIRQLIDAGCRYIQIDAPGYTAYVDEVSLDRMRARGEDPEANLDRSIKADNAMIAGFEGVTFGLHICRGNARTIDPETGKIAAQWHREGAYDAIAERLFSELTHQRLLLEYDSARSGGFAPLRFVRKGVVAVLGLVSTKSEEIEDAAALKARIAEAERYLPLDRLALSPQCGFGGMDPIHPQIAEAIQWRKFERIVETAREVWGDRRADHPAQPRVRSTG
jgi:5-methyltetrahydropteroyltriglutamate--homocysteine methyltransferase